MQNNQKNVVPLSEQIEQFFNVHGKLMAAIGPAGTENFLSKSLFFISTGSNDIFTYYHSTSTLPKQEFISTLALAYENYLRVRFLPHCSHIYALLKFSNRILVHGTELEFIFRLCLTLVQGSLAK